MLCQVFGCERLGGNERKLKCTCRVHICDECVQRTKNGARLVIPMYHHSTFCNNDDLRGIKKRFQLLTW